MRSPKASGGWPGFGRLGSFGLRGFCLGAHDPGKHGQKSRLGVGKTEAPADGPQTSTLFGGLKGGKLEPRIDKMPG